MTMPPAATNNI